MSILKPHRGLIKRKRRGFFIRRKMKSLPPISPKALIPLNAQEESFIDAIRQKHMERTGCQPEDFLAYFVGYGVKGHKVNCRAVAIRRLKIKD